MRGRRMIRKLKREIVRRRVTEEKLKKSEHARRDFIRLLKESKSKKKHALNFTRQLLLAQEKERKEISHRLHEKFAQALTGINLHLAALKTEVAISNQSLNKRITQTQRILNRSLKSVLRFAHHLHPRLLDDLGLIPALAAHTRDFMKRTGTPVHFKYVADVEKLNYVKRAVLYRVAQTVLKNIAQNAQASLVKLTLRMKHNSVEMQIEDNGKYFQFERALLAQKKDLLVLLGMRERVEMVGGKLVIESAKGTGANVLVEIPLQ